MKILLDENLSPSLIGRLASLGVAATHVTRLGRAGQTDARLFAHAFENDYAIATINTRDFMILARGAELHAGLFLLRAAGLNAEGQWTHLEPAVADALRRAASGDDMTNVVVEILGIGRFTRARVPP